MFDPDAFIPYGGEDGFMGNDVARYDIDISYNDCKIYTSLHINRSFLFVDLFAKNIEYDTDGFGSVFSFRSEFYTPPVPECKGVKNEGDNIIKGLRL